MAFSEAELARYKKLMDAFIEKRRPAEDIRDKLDLSYRFEDQSIIIFTIRPAWDDPEVKIESPFAKARWVKSNNAWSIYWMPGSRKWTTHPYWPVVAKLQEFIEIVDEDDHRLFFG